MYECCSSHDKDLCMGTMPFVAYSIHLMPKQTSQPLYCSNFCCSCTPCVLYCPLLAATRDYSSQQLRNNCNCQNNKCFFAVLLYISFSSPIHKLLWHPPSLAIIKVQSPKLPLLSTCNLVISHALCLQPCF